MVSVSYASALLLSMRQRMGTAGTFPLGLGCESRVFKKKMLIRQIYLPSALLELEDDLASTELVVSGVADFPAPVGYQPPVVVPPAHSPVAVIQPAFSPVAAAAPPKAEAEGDEPRMDPRLLAGRAATRAEARAARAKDKEMAEAAAQRSSEVAEAEKAVKAALMPALRVSNQVELAKALHMPARAGADATAFFRGVEWALPETPPRIASTGFGTASSSGSPAAPSRSPPAVMSSLDPRAKEFVPSANTAAWLQQQLLPPPPHALHPSKLQNYWLLPPPPLGPAPLQPAPTSGPDFFSAEEQKLLGMQLCEELGGIVGRETSPGSARTSYGTERETGEEETSSSDELRAAKFHAAAWAVVAPR